VSLRVALFTDSYRPTVDGVVNSVLATRQSLEAHGHRVFTFAPEDPDNGHSVERDTIFLKAKGFRPYPGYRLAVFPGHEISVLSDLDVDVIHSHGVGFMGIKGLWCSWATKIPFVQTYHTQVQEALRYYSPVNLSPRFLQRLLRIYLRVFLGRCDAVIALTRTMMRELRALAPGMQRCRVIPTGVDTRRFQPGLDADWVRDRWGLNGGKMILHVGRIAPEKNLPVILAAMTSVRRVYPEAKLVVVGVGPQLDECKALAARLGLEDAIRFAGFVPDEDLPAYYAACDVFATASTFEVHPMVVLEALASGRPVAGANAGGIPEFVRHGENGALFDPSDPRGAADAMLLSLEKGETMQEAARATALNYSVGRCTRQLEDVYRTLMPS